MIIDLQDDRRAGRRGYLAQAMTLTLLTGRSLKTSTVSRSPGGMAR